MSMLVRRLTAAALFAGLFTLQLSLVGTGAACTMDERGMRGHLAEETSVSSSFSEPVTEHDPCEHPASPSECRMMAPCGALFAPANLAAARQPTPLTETTFAALEAMPPSVSFPPERRPPRA